MQAHWNGNAIEFKMVDDYTEPEWMSIPCPQWNWEECDYRIKRVPKTIWVNTYEDGIECRYDTKYEADYYAGLARVVCRKFVEVIE
jgi:hypothetical protein